MRQVSVLSVSLCLTVSAAFTGSRTPAQAGGESAQLPDKYYPSAVGCQLKGELDEAERYARRSVECSASKVDKDLIGKYLFLSHLLLYLEKYRESELTMRKALKISERIRENQKTLKAACLSKLALCMQLQGRYREALSLFERADEHRDMKAPESTATLSYLYAKTGRPIKAKEYFLLAMRQSDYRASNQLSGYMQELFKYYARPTSFDYQKALHNLELQLKIDREWASKFKPEGIVLIANDIRQITNFLWRHNKQAEARKYLEELVQLDENISGKRSMKYAETSSLLGKIALDAGDIASAKKQLDPSYEILFPASANLTAQPGFSLAPIFVEFLNKTGRTEESLELSKRLEKAKAEISKSIPEDDECGWFNRRGPRTAVGECFGEY